MNNTIGNRLKTLRESIGKSQKNKKKEKTEIIQLQ